MEQGEERATYLRQQKNMAKQGTIVVEETEISLLARGGRQEEFLSLTDMAKKFGDPRIVIQNWMRARNTLQFLGVWETLKNPLFNRIEFDAFLFEAGSNAFTMSPTKWIEATQAVGMVSKPGRNGGTFAHKDIAFGFGYWLSPPFQLYLIQEFQRLKEAEAAEQQQALDWGMKRLLSKVNYLIHTDAVRQHLVPPRIHGTRQEGLYYATEADLLNLAMFGLTAKMWREGNPSTSGNLRDHASAEQLLVLANLENLNAEFIRQGMSKEQRLERLNEIAIYQMQLLLQAPAMKELSNGAP